MSVEKRRWGFSFLKSKIISHHIRQFVLRLTQKNVTDAVLLKKSLKIYSKTDYTTSNRSLFGIL